MCRGGEVRACVAHVAHGGPRDKRRSKPPDAFAPIVVVPISAFCCCSCSADRQGGGGTTPNAVPTHKPTRICTYVDDPSAKALGLCCFGLLWRGAVWPTIIVAGAITCVCHDSMSYATRPGALEDCALTMTNRCALLLQLQLLHTYRILACACTVYCSHASALLFLLHHCHVACWPQGLLLALLLRYVGKT